MADLENSKKYVPLVKLYCPWLMCGQYFCTLGIYFALLSSSIIMHIMMQKTGL